MLGAGFGVQFIVHAMHNPHNHTCKEKREERREKREERREQREERREKREERKEKTEERREKRDEKRDKRSDLHFRGTTFCVIVLVLLV
jgi:hypothetical protein